MAQSRQLILASASPRRAALLEQIGVAFTVIPANVDEARRDDESAESYVARLAKTKARAVANTAPENTAILGADTVVVKNGEILLKPRDDADARHMLSTLSGAPHEVLTSVALALADDESHCETIVVKTSVRFRELSAREIARYVAGGEPQDKAGAYGIQGVAGAFVESITGSYSNVVGLPLAETYRLLVENGVETALS